MQLRHQTSCSKRCVGVFGSRKRTQPWTGGVWSALQCPAVANTARERFPSAAHLPRTLEGPDSTASGVWSLTSWDYKYQHRRCCSPCEPDDVNCLKLEALCQNVLDHPRLPPRICTYMSKYPYDIDEVTCNLENLSSKYGKEFALYLAKREPAILSKSIDVVEQREKQLTSLLSLTSVEILTVLRKNPRLLCFDFEETKSKYMQLPKLTPFGADGVRTLVIKYPLILNYQTATVKQVIEDLRDFAYTRGTWQDDFELMSPSLFAFFYRDREDILLRLEYLVLTGESSAWRLRHIFKMTNNNFCFHKPGFKTWERQRYREARRIAKASR